MLRFTIGLCFPSGVQAMQSRTDQSSGTTQTWPEFSSTPIKSSIQRPPKRPRLEEEESEEELTEESMDLELPHDSTYDPAASTSAVSTDASVADAPTFV